MVYRPEAFVYGPATLESAWFGPEQTGAAAAALDIACATLRLDQDDPLAGPKRCLHHAKAVTEPV